MYGYSQINPDRGMYYARKALELGTRKDWLWRMVDANRMLGQYHYGGKQYDSTYATFMTNPSSNHAGYHFHKDLLDAWTTTNTGSDIL